MFSAGQKLRGHTSPELDGPTPHHAGVANDPSEKHAYCQSACSFTPYDAIRYHMCVQSLNPHLIPAVMPHFSLWVHSGPGKRSIRTMVGCLE